MHFPSILSRLLYGCLLLGLSLFTQCDCKNPDQKGQNNKGKTKRKTLEGKSIGSGGGNTTPAPSPTPPGPPNPPIPNPPPAGSFLQNLNLGGLQAGGETFLLKSLQSIKRAFEKDPSQVNNIIQSREGRDDGATLLHAVVAVNYDNTDKEIKVKKLDEIKQIIEDFVRLGADINAEDDKGQTPLYHAIKENKLELVNTLLDQGAALDIPDARGYTPLHAAAAESGKMQFLQALLKKATPEQLNQPDKNGPTPLHVAVLNGNLAAVKALIQQGVTKDEINKNSSDGRNALHLAAARGYDDIVEALVAAGADKTSIADLSGTAPNAPTVKDELIQVLQAANRGFLVKKLRNPTQNIDERDPTKNNTTALQQAAILGTVDAVKILLAHGAAIDLADTNGCTPLLLAGFANNLDVVKVLVDWGADINAKTKSSETLLHDAAAKGNLKLVQYLLNQKSTLVNLRGKGTQTPLYIAVVKDNKQIVQALIEEGADVNLLGMVGYSDDKYPLRVAIKQNNPQIVAMLLEKGATVSQKDIDSATPAIQPLLQVAMLLQSGATVRQADVDGATPAIKQLMLHLAINKGNQPLMTMLLKAGTPVSLADIEEANKIAGLPDEIKRLLKANKKIDA